MDASHGMGWNPSHFGSEHIKGDLSKILPQPSALLCWDPLHTQPKNVGGPEPPQIPPDLTNLPLLPAPSFKGMLSEKAQSLQAIADRVSLPPFFFYMLK